MRQRPPGRRHAELASTTPQEAKLVVNDIEHAMARYLRALVWLDKGYSLREVKLPIAVVLLDDATGAGSVVCTTPAWGKRIELPAGWVPAIEVCVIGTNRIHFVLFGMQNRTFDLRFGSHARVSICSDGGCVCPSLKPVGYTWSCLACRIGHFVPVWQPIIGSSFQ
jgi:hypothetical protein